MVFYFCLLAPGSYCPFSATVPLSCPNGTFAPEKQMYMCSACPNDAFCNCPPGSFLSDNSCQTCPAGNYCVGANAASLPCPAGTVMLSSQSIFHLIVRCGQPRCDCSLFSFFLFIVAFSLVACVCVCVDLFCFVASFVDMHFDPSSPLVSSFRFLLPCQCDRSSCVRFVHVLPCRFSCPVVLPYW
jgi:hypothetical protein